MTDVAATDIAATVAILPGSTIGVLGSGQLGRMFAMAARAMGYRVHVLSPDDGTPTGQVADWEIQADYGDLDRVAAFARAVDVVTFEFENIPGPGSRRRRRQLSGAARSACAVHGPASLAREDLPLGRRFPVVPFRHVKSLGELTAAMRPSSARRPCSKPPAGDTTARARPKSTSLAGAAEAWAPGGGRRAVLEAFIDFECEVSVVAARGLDGDVADYGRDRQYARESYPRRFGFAGRRRPNRSRARPWHIAHAILESLDVVGVLCVEFFVTRNGKLVINEMAPRPHNSGHLTFDAAHDQPVRATVAGDLRVAAGLDGPPAAGGHGQPAGRPVARVACPTGWRRAAIRT